MEPNCCEHCRNAGEDHDILIEIKTNMKTFMRASADHETRIRRAERWGFLAIGALFVIDAVISLVIAAVVSHFGH